MGCEVYANSMSIACKAADGKTIAAFPDVCMTPPTAPPTPPGVPIPYPNTAMASDTSEGSKTVMISGQEVMLKDKSVFKTSTGDEAGSAPKKGVVTSQIKGKASFVAWSMDVKFEGENVPRHLDVTLHNEQSLPANTPTWPYIDGMSVPDQEKCAADKDKEYQACKDFTPHNSNGQSPCPPDGKPTKETVESYADRTAGNKCVAARRCQLVPYEPTGDRPHCCPGQTGHHLVEAGSFFNKGRGGSKSTSLMETEDYNTDKAPCICAEGTNQYQGTHGLLHTFQSTAAMSKETIAELELADGRVLKAKSTTYGDARDQGVAAAKKTFPESGCNEGCIKAQLDAYHNQCGIDDKTECRQIVTGYKGAEPLAAAEQSVRDRSARIVAQRAGAATSAPTW